MKLLKALFTVSLFLFFCLMANGQDTLVLWNFDGNGGTLNSTPGSAIAANDGIAMGTVGGTGTPINTSFGGAQLQHIQATGWDSGSGSKAWKTASFATTGYNTLTIGFKLRSINCGFVNCSGPRDWKVQYSTNNSTWTDLAGGTVTADDNWTTGAVSGLSLPATLDGQATVWLRWIMTSNTSVDGANPTVGSSGTTAFDDVVVKGTAGACTAPSVTTNPTNQTICAGGNVNFTAAATGTAPVSVQWQVNNGGGFSNIGGATSTTLSLTNVLAAQSGNTYQAVFTNACGSATTTAATLTVNTAPIVSAPPASTASCPGGNVSFIAAATGTPAPTVQWQVNTGGGFSNIGGATSTTLNVNGVTAGMDGNTYRAVFTNTCGSVNSSAATLTVYAAPSVTTQPINDTTCENTNATFTAAASGNPAPTVQWQENSGGGFGNIGGATNATLTLNSVTTSMTGNTYQAIFTNTCGSATTSTARLEVDTLPIIILNPVSDTLCEGDNITLTVLATGTTPITVQWQKNGTNMPGEVSTTLTLSNFMASDAANYRAAFTNKCGTTTTANATLTYNNFPDNVTNSADAGGGSFRQRVADACSGDTITFDGGTDGNPVTLTSGMVIIDKDLVIIGNGALNTVIDAGSNSRVLKIEPGVQVELLEMTLSGGLTPATVNGGGIWNEGSDVVLDGVEIKDNTAGGFGGGIHNSNGGSVEILNSTLASNTATGGGPSNGGGIYSTGGGASVTIINSTISGNSADDNGGGVYVDNGDLEVRNATITGNSAGSNGGGLYMGASSGNIVIGNSIVAANLATTGADINNVSGPLNSQNYNVVGDTTDANWIVAIEDIVGDDATPVNPVLDILATNNGATRTHQLLCYSPALNTGDPTDTSSTDQRGLPRFIGENDRGALESQQELAVDSPYVVAGFTLVPDKGCVIPHAVTFTYQAQFANDWEWFFGDGTTSSVQDPVHNYTAEGQYGVTLVVEDTLTGCQDVLTQLLKVVNPVADFSASPTFGCGPMTVSFNDASVGAESWHWEFGTGDTANVPNPTYTFDEPGNYTITLTVTSASGCTDTEIKTNFITVIGPDVNFGADTLTGCNPFQVQFTDSTIFGAPITSWIWDFGDNSGSNIQNSSHTYTSSGQFTVTLTVTDLDGCVRSLSKTNYINVGAAPTFAVSPNQSICLGDSVDLSVNGGASYEWSTGETTSTIRVSPATFRKYNITVTGANFCKSTGSVIVTVNNLPNANAGGDDNICLGETKSITATGGTSYRWNNGTGTANINVSPITTTTYTVTVTDGNNCSNTDSAVITVDSLPIADAGINDTICFGDTAILDATGGVSYLWSNGVNVSQLSDAPSSTTTYTVTVTGANSCTASDEAMIVVNPLPIVVTTDATICIGDSGIISASGGTSYIWSTGDTSSSIKVARTSFGKFNVTVTDDNGCSKVASPLVFVNPLPTADAGVDDTTCMGTSATLTATGGTSYSWSNGGNTAAITVTPTVATTYTVTVTDGNGCMDTDDVTVLLDTLPAIDAGPGDTICLGDSATLTAIADASLLFAWSNGDVTMSTTVGPIVSSYFNVTATDGNGCVGIDSAWVKVNPLPAPVLSGLQAAYCVNEEVDTLVGLPAGGIFGGTFLTSEQLDPGTTPVGGPYEAKYTVTDVNGCTDSVSKSYDILALPVVSFSGLDPTYCIDTVPVPLAGSPAGGAFSGPGIQGSFFTSFYAGVGTHSIVYTYTDPNGCTVSDTQTVEVFALPVVNFPALNVAYCEDDATVNLIATPLGGVFSGAGVTGNTFEPGKSNLGNVAINYEYTDANGCEATVGQVVKVNANPTLTFNLASEFCINGTAVSLNAQPAGGVFGGDGVTSSVFDPAAAGLGSGEVYYTYENAAGCSDTVFKTITVNEPTPVSFSLPTEICQNDPLIFLTGVPAGGIFSGLGVVGNTFDPEIPGTGGPYDIAYTYTNSSGCVSTDTQSITVNGVPFAGIFGIDSAYCLYESNEVVISAGPAGGILNGPGITSDTTFNANAAGLGRHVIQYAVTSADGCVGIAQEVVIVDACTGIDEVMGMEVMLYPNPTSGWLNIDVQGIQEDLLIQIFDVQGKEVYQDESSAIQQFRTLHIDLNDISTGLYYVKLTTANEALVKKVIVE